MWKMIKKIGNIFCILAGLGFLLFSLYVYDWDFIKAFKAFTESVSEVFTTTFILFLIVCWNIDTLNEKLEEIKKQKCE